MNRTAIEAHVNGELTTLAPGTSVADIVVNLVGAEGHRAVAVARNGAVVARSQWDTTHVEAGDEIEVVRPIQGG